MKKSTIEKIEKEIDEKSKLPDNIKDNIRKEVFTNILIAVIIILYFIFIVSGSIGTTKNVRTIDLNIFSILFLAIAITLFEIAYRKENVKLAVHGVESLVIAIFTLFLPYIIFELDETYKKYYLMSSIYIATYYSIKSIYISTKTKNTYMNSISDINEILKKEKSKKINSENIEERKEEIDNYSNTKQIQDKQNKEEIIHKKRGRPKKVQSIKQEENKKQKTKETKKRGRPRKAVTNND